MKNMKFSKRLDQFPEYIFAKLCNRINEIENRTGRKVLNLGVGSPDFPPSRVYLNKLRKYIDEPGGHLYPGHGAIPLFSEALREWYKQRFDVNLKNNELYPLLGSRDGVSHLPLALCDAGDEILVPDPGYPAFCGPALMMGVKPVFYNLLEKNDFKTDVRELEKKATRKTKYIWVNFPSNPTGQTVTVGELAPLVAFARRHHIWLLYDNAYCEITFDGFVAPSILQIEGAEEVSVEIGSFSKTFSFAGFRMGWIVGNGLVISALAKVKSQIDSGMALPIQKLGAYALTHPDGDWHSGMIESYKNRRDIIIERLHRIGLHAEKRPGSLYLWAKIPDMCKDSEAYAAKLLEEKRIVVTPGTAFGKNGARYVRVCFCANIDHIDEYL